jgi:hypothetical protein
MPLPTKKKRTTECWSSVVHSQTRSPFSLLKPASEHSHARLLPRLSCSWTVLLPGGIHRKPVTSITLVLLQFVTYLLTLPRINILNTGLCYFMNCKSMYWAGKHNSTTLDSYSGGSRFEPWPGPCLTWLRYFVVVLGPSKQIPGYYVDHFLRNPI